MDFGLTDEQEALQRSAREFLARECPPTFVRETAKTPDGFSRRLHEEMAGLGWTGLIVPEAYGGLGLGLLDMALLLEELGRAATPGPFVSACLLSAVALQKASPALKKRWFPGVAAGTAIGTVAISEESDRVDGAGITARARRSGGAYELNGTKLFVTDAGVADFLIAAFRTAGKGDAGITLFLVPRDTPGLRVAPLESVDLTRRVYEVEFRRLRLPATHVIGTPGAGWPILQAVIDAGALAIAADSLGGAQRLADMAVEYAKVRVQFDRPIGSFQAVKHMAAEMIAEIEPARSLVWHAGYRLDTAPRRAAEAVAMAKARLCDVYSFVANRALQMHGGIGFTWEHDLHFWYKRAVWNRAAFGDPAFHRERVAALGGF